MQDAVLIGIRIVQVLYRLAQAQRIAVHRLTIICVMHQQDGHASRLVGILVLLPRVAVDVVPSPMVVGELFIVGLAL